MNLISVNKIFYFLIVLLAFYSCKTTKKAVRKEVRSVELSEVIERKVSKNDRKKYLSENIEITIKEKISQTGRGRIFISEGELIFMNIAYLGFELGRIMITPDSVKFINRVKREYYFGGIRDIKKLTGLDYDYHEIENFLIKGIPFKEKEDIKDLQRRFTQKDEQIIYNYEYDSNRYVKIYFDKEVIKENKIELTDNERNIYVIATLDNYLDKSIYPGSIKVLIVKNSKRNEVEINIKSIVNKDYKNIIFQINNSYNEMEF